MQLWDDLYNSMDMKLKLFFMTLLKTQEEIHLFFPGAKCDKRDAAARGLALLRHPLHAGRHQQPRQRQEPHHKAQVGRPILVYKLFLV